MTKEVTISVTGAAAAAMLAPVMMWPWRRVTTVSIRPSSKASRLSILTTLTPSIPSMIAVERLEVSSMAPLAARLDHLVKRCMSAPISGPTRTTPAVRIGSLNAITSTRPATMAAFCT